MGFAGPVAKAVGDHLDHPHVTEIEGVSGAGVVDVVARLIRHQTVVGGIVDALERQGRAAFVAFRGMVVDDVEDHLDAGVVATGHHLLELAQGLLAFMCVARVRGEEADCVVAPIVGQAAFEQVAVVYKSVDRQQLERGYPEGFEVIDYNLAAEPLIGPAVGFRHRGMELGKAAQMRLIKNGAVPRNGAAAGLAGPVEIGVDDDAFGHERRAVALVEAGIVARFHLIAKDRRIPFQLAEMPSRIRVEQQLVGVEAVALFRLVGPMHPIAVDRSRRHPWHIAVPDLVGIFGKLDARGFALLVEQADLDSRRMRREQREIDACAIPGRPERVRQPLGDVRLVHLPAPCRSVLARDNVWPQRFIRSNRNPIGLSGSIGAAAHGTACRSSNFSAPSRRPSRPGEGGRRDGPAARRARRSASGPDRRGDRALKGSDSRPTRGRRRARPDSRR